MNPESTGTVLLWGMMGTGKSTVAQHLCATTALRVKDLDQYLVNQMGQSIPEMIETGGWEAFRRLEQETLLSVLSKGDTDIIALGGGTLLDAAFRNHLRSKTYICSLFASTRTIASRVSDTLSCRPLLRQSSHALEARIGQLLDERRAAYLDVDLVVDTSRRSAAEVAECLSELFLWRNVA